MAEVPGGSASSSPFANQLFRHKAKKIAQELLTATDKFYIVKKQMEKNYKTYVKLCEEQTSVCLSLLKYNENWLEHACVLLESDARQVLNIEARCFANILQIWRPRMDVLSGIFESYFGQMKEHLVALHTEMDKLTGAKNWADLENASVPKSDWNQAVSETDTEKLMDEWNKLELQPRIQSLLFRMQQLTESESQNVSNSELER